MLILKRSFTSTAIVVNLLLLSTVITTIAETGKEFNYSSSYSSDVTPKICKAKLFGFTGTYLNQAINSSNFGRYYPNGKDQSQEGVVYENDIKLGGYLYTEYFQTKEKAKNFDLHYLALSVSGWASEEISFLAEFELEHGGKGDNTFVEQAFIDYWFKRNIALKIGAMLVPFNRFDDFHEPLANTLITRSQVSREIGVSAWKDVGVNLHGYLDLNADNSIGIDLYGINGLGAGNNLRGSRHYRDNNENIALGGRILLVNSRGLEVGGSFYTGAWDDSSNFDVNMIGAHFMFNTEIADFYGEYSSATSQNPDSAGAKFKDGEMSGYFIQVSKLVHNKYRPTIRFGGLDYLDKRVFIPNAPTDMITIESTNKQLTEFAFGFSYYPTSDVVFKIEYSIFSEGDRVKENKDNNQLGLQAAIKF